MQLKDIKKIVKKTFKMNFSDEREVIGFKSVDSCITCFFELATGKKRNDMYYGHFAIIDIGNEKLTLNYSLPKLWAMDNGNKITNPAFLSTSENIYLDDNEDELVSAVQKICDLYVNLFDNARQNLDNYLKLPSIQLDNDILCQQIGENFFEYSYGDWFITVFENYSESTVTQEPQTTFHYSIYYKTYGSLKGSGSWTDNQSHLIFQELFRRA